MIRTRGLTKHYGATTALERLDLDVAAGSVFGFLGPNGSGKTTTIRLLIGLIAPTHGTAEIAGVDVARDPTRVHALVGYLSGSFRAFPDMTAERYLGYLADLRGGAGRAAIGPLAERLELPLGRRIADLSHGNRQKVGIVQACMGEPPVLLLDEPTQGLDPLMQHVFLDLVREARERGATVFLSSHILSEVDAVADRIGVLREGRLAAVDTVAHLRARAVRRLALRFSEPPPREVLSGVAGVRDLVVDGTALQLTVEGSTAALMAALAPYRVEDVVSREPDLEEVFLSVYDGAHA
ncbi:MAG: ABC transporter ATP-binding protein [Gaiellales bacterium]